MLQKHMCLCWMSLIQHERNRLFNIHVTVRQYLTRSFCGAPSTSTNAFSTAFDSEAVPHPLLLVVDRRNDSLGPFNQPLPRHACPKAVPCSNDQSHCRQTWGMLCQQPMQCAQRPS